MENITFTTEQKEQIKNNALAIERYIVEDVVPRLAGDVRLESRFHRNKRRNRC